MSAKVSCGGMTWGVKALLSVCCINMRTNPSQQSEDTNNMLHKPVALKKGSVI